MNCFSSFILAVAFFVSGKVSRRKMFWSNKILYLGIFSSNFREPNGMYITTEGIPFSLGRFPRYSKLELGTHSYKSLEVMFGKDSLTLLYLYLRVKVCRYELGRVPQFSVAWIDKLYLSIDHFQFVLQVSHFLLASFCIY